MKLLIIACFVSSFLTSCNKAGAPKPPPGVSSLKPYELAGLRLELPEEPSSLDIELPPSIKPHVSLMENYVIDGNSTQFFVTHAIYNLSEASLEGTADGAIAEVRGLSGISDFMSTKEAVEVAGLDGIQIVMTYQTSGQSMYQHALAFVRKNEMWQVQVIGTGVDHVTALEALKDAIFASVELLD